MPDGNRVEADVPSKRGSRRFESLNDRERRGVELWQRAQIQNGMRLEFDPETTGWISQNDSNRFYRVVRTTRNRRGTLDLEYRCECQDFLKQGRVDCKHIFAEKLRRSEVFVDGIPKRQKSHSQTKATRQPARSRLAYDGRSIRSTQRSAKREMPERIHELTFSLKHAFDLHGKTSGDANSARDNPRGKKPAPISTRATALLAKVAAGVSASEMMSEYDRLRLNGSLHLRRTPNENTLSKWMNDERITPVLRELLRMTAAPFRERECGAIIDSSKVSQLMTAHQKSVEYDPHDKRPHADWIKCHALVGAETLIVMAVEFSTVLGAGTHDVNFLEPLVEEALRTFPLKYLLGDKAYLAQHVLEYLAGRGLKAVIPVKKRWFEKGAFHEVIKELVEFFDRNDNRDFHELYRFRPKVECLFSLLKRMATGYCWSRGRKRKRRSDDKPSTAWINELLCKFIYVNLRTTVTLECETGVRIDYRVPDRRFPVSANPVLRSAA